MQIGLIGFGRFGRLAVRHLAPDFEVLVYTPAGRFDEIEALGGKPVSFIEACIADVVILSVPISQFEETVQYAAPFLRPGAVIVDVCSVKEYPVWCMLKHVPEQVGILATHPMFGPDSAKDSIRNAKMVLCPVRVDEEVYRRFKIYLLRKGLVITEASPEEHDRDTALSLALPHFVGRALEEMGVKPLAIDTEGYKRLLTILGVVTNDTWQLFMDMQNYNRFAEVTRRNFMAALNKVEDKINA